MPRPLPSFYPRPTAPSSPAVWCPACEHENPDGARYCNDCGARLDLRECPLCEAMNDGTATQCYRCGTVIGAQHAVENEDAEAAPREVDEITDAASTSDLFPNLADLRECRHCEALTEASAATCHRCGAPFVATSGPVPPVPDAAATEGDTATPQHDAQGAATPDAGHHGNAPGRATREASTDQDDRSPIREPLPPSIVEQACGQAEPSAVPNPLLDDELPLHYVGPLTARLDEAELADPDLDAEPPRRWRGRLVLAGMLALMLLPAALAGALYAYGDRGALDHVVARARATLGSMLPVAPAPEAQTATPQNEIDAAGALQDRNAPAGDADRPRGAVEEHPSAPPAVQPDRTAVLGIPRPAAQAAPATPPRGARSLARAPAVRERIARARGQQRTAPQATRSARGSAKAGFAAPRSRNVVAANTGDSAARQCVGTAIATRLCSHLAELRGQ